MLSGLAAFILAYVFYGKFLRNQFRLKDSNPPPSQTMGDGVDYVPGRLPVLMGHHFASIAGAGPIVGPILAIKYGWVPVFLWIVVGTIVIGAIHDFAALIASIRHQGRSISALIEHYVGVKAKLLFSGFAFFTLILVVAVFTDVVAETFSSEPRVASSSLYFILLAMAYGFLNYRFGLRGGLSIIIAVSLVAGAISLGFLKGLEGNYLTWVICLMFYIYLASTVPVWVLLQPRDYLSSFILYALLLTTGAGVLLSGNTVAAPSFTGFSIDGGDLIFPFLFVTVACGAVSGFHSLVSSGTTAKQLEKESHALPVGYGMMLVESLLALIALAAAAVMTTGDYSQTLADGGPIMVFAQGVGSFLSIFNLPPETGRIFAALAVSAFALTSLDTSTRLARFILEEMVLKRPAGRVRFLTTLIVVALSAVMLASGGAETIWPVFGSANQLLAALALLAVLAWMNKTRISHRHIIRYPMYFVFAFSMTALALIGYNNVLAGDYVLAAVAGLLFGLSLVVIHETRTVIRG